MSHDGSPPTGRYRLTQGPLVARLRRRVGLSQAELGRRVGRTEGWVGQVERGAHEVDRLSVLRDLADALGVSVFDLIPDLGEPRPGDPAHHRPGEGPAGAGDDSGASRRVPKYRRIADDLRSSIESGEYSPGDRLPREADLMTRYGVARMTARQALSVLAADGFATSRGGAVLVTDPPAAPAGGEDALRAMADELRAIRAVLVEFGARLRRMEGALGLRDDAPVGPRGGDVPTS